MPIEIRELVIKAVVAPEGKEQPETITAADLSKLKKEITDDVVKRVVKILTQKNER